MKRIEILVIYMLLLLSSCGNLHAQSVHNNLAQTGAITEAQVAMIFNRTSEFPDNTQISIAFVTDSLFRFYGIKKQNDTLITVDNFNAVFEIGSITKVFTATLLANSVMEGRVNLNENINPHLPFSLNRGLTVTFKELANHTSGLPRVPSNMLLSAIFNPANPYKNYDEDKLEKYLSGKAKLSGEAGKQYAYSNLGAGLLAYTLCKVEDKSYEALLDEKIFSKYDMCNSSSSRDTLKEKLIGGLDSKGNSIPNWDLASLEGAGAILSTAEDLSKFALAQFDESNQELALTRKQTFTINEKMDVGLGWHIIKTESGDRWHWHNGGTGGYSSSMAIDTKSRTGIVILSNVSAANKKRSNIEDLCFELLRTMN